MGIPIDELQIDSDSESTVDNTQIEKDVDTFKALPFNILIDDTSHILSHRHTSSQKLQQFIDTIRSSASNGGINLDYVMSSLFPWHFIFHNNTPCGDIPSKWYATNDLQKNGYEKVESQMRAMVSTPSRTIGRESTSRAALFNIRLMLLLTRTIMQGFHTKGITEDVMRKVGIKQGQCSTAMEQNMSFNKADSKRKMRELVAMVDAYGKPTFFVTLTPNFQGFPGLTEIMTAIGHRFHKLPSAIPQICAQWHEGMRNILSWLIDGDDKPLGNVQHYWGRHEYQTNVGHLSHAHFLFWTDETDEEAGICSYTFMHIICILSILFTYMYIFYQREGLLLILFFIGRMMTIYETWLLLD